MTEMEKINQMTDDSMMDYVDDPGNEPKKEGRIKKLVKKAKPVGKKVVKELGSLTFYGAVAGTVATGMYMGICHLTGREIATLPKGGTEVIKGICTDIADRLKEIEAGDVVEAAKDAVEDTIDK
ncbi:MAG: hypothetical protein J6I76_00185 [Oribacterium sp.]|nr:hypothetical protein [Oribacterium sp.]